MWQPSILLIPIFLIQTYAAPQFVTFKEGKLGVNFGGYHAAVGLGGLLGGQSGAGGGLFAEAGTPYGQEAKAGLGGSTGGNGGGPAGGLYAGATAGGNVKAEAGLAGEIVGDKLAGGGYSSASSGGHYSGLIGTTAVKEFKVPINEANNEIVPASKPYAEAKFDVKAEVQPSIIVKEVYAEPPPSKTVEKAVIYTHKPHKHNFRKTAYVGGYVGAGAHAGGMVQPTEFKTIQPIERRSDVVAEAEVHANAGSDYHPKHGGAGEVSYTKKVTVQRNPTFFQDIFNIPIATLKAVNSFLTNAAGSTSVSLQKSASVQAETNLATSKHVPESKSVASSSEAHISVETPSATKFIDDIFSIPINTLSAVNTFLENNAGRKQVQVRSDGSDEPTKVKLRPHARRRANKHVVIVEEPTKRELSTETSESE